MDDVRLFCSSCNVVVDHLRKFVVYKHLEAASHKRNAVRKDNGKQQTLKTVMNCKTVAQVEKVCICYFEIGLLSYFFVKKIPLSRRVGYVIDGSMGQ